MSRLTEFSRLLRSKKDLMLCIFMTLMLQLSISIATMKFDQERQLLKDYNPIMVSIVGILIIIFIIYKIHDPKLSFFVKQLLFLVISVFFGLLISQVVHLIDDKKVVEAAAISTLVNFGVMLLVGLVIVYFKYDLGWMGIFLFIALLSVIITRIFLLFTDKEQREKNNYYLSRFVVLLFSLYILYDTNNILLKYKNKDKTHCIMGALNYYLDILNLFTEYLAINSE
jgi:FtsH-binding integral membrane protein